jgi:lipoprotein-anchoring transpeptidase ErfK/SrfK
MFKKTIAAAAIGTAALFASATAHASLLARVDVSSQTMNVYVDGQLTYRWLVSTARKGYYTPRGSYHPQRLEAVYFSKKYDNAPMPHAVFFNGGYAIHGSYAVRSLGRPASHGCIRLAPGNAAEFYSLVQSEGRGATRIIVTD